MKILLTYLMFLIPGQIASGLIGLFLDQYSKAAGITAFIVCYYAMFYLAWRGTLLIVDKPAASDTKSGGSRAAAASVLLAPALLALDLAE
ncbi:MAG: hypothetical protein AB1490_09360 [Pseudomonadota bacterium]